MSNFARKAIGLVMLLMFVTCFYYNMYEVRAVFSKSITAEDQWAEARTNSPSTANEQEDMLTIINGSYVKEDTGTTLSNVSNITRSGPNRNGVCFETLRRNPSSTVQDMKRRLVNLTNVLHSKIVELLEDTLTTTTADLSSLQQEIQMIRKPHRCSSCSGNRSFPANLIGTKISIPSCGIWNGLRLPVIAVAPIGRLGNVMGEYASIFALKELFNMSAVLTNRHKATLEENFPRLSLPVVEMGPMENWTGLPEELPFYPFYGGLQLASLGLLGSRLFLSTGYPFEMRLFHAHRHKIRQEFSFADHLVNKAQKFLTEAAENSVGIVPNKPVSFVGVHIRRTDYVGHMTTGFGIQVDYKQYIERAVHYYESKYENLVFIVASDDFKYSATMFNFSDPRNVFFSHRSPRRNSSLASTPPSPKSAGEDMSLLAQCNHSVITLGTFGFWAGYLSSGTVVYPDVKTTELYPLSRPFYEDAKIENFIPMDL